MEQMDKIKKLTASSSSFAVLFKESSQEHEILCAQALTTALFLCDRSVYQLSLLSETIKQKWSPLLVDIPAEAIPQITSIKIPANETEIKEMSYEKNNGTLELRISSTGPLNIKGVSLEQKPEVIDLVFSFGGEEAAPNINYKNIISFSPDTDTVSEKVLTAIKELKITDTKNLAIISSLLLAALIMETDNFTKHFDPQTLAAGKELLEMGADKKTISSVLEKAKSTPLTQILGRAMARTRASEDAKTSWTFLSREDFEKSANPPPDAPAILDIVHRLRALMPAPPMMIALWQDEGGVEVMIKNFDNSPEAKEKILSLAHKAACPLQNDFFVMGPFKNFTEAELQTQKMLKEETI